MQAALVAHAIRLALIARAFVQRILRLVIAPGARAFGVRAFRSLVARSQSERGDDRDGGEDKVAHSIAIGWYASLSSTTARTPGIPSAATRAALRLPGSSDSIIPWNLTTPFCTVTLAKSARHQG